MSDRWPLVACVAIAATLVIMCGRSTVCQGSIGQVLQLAGTIVGGVFGVWHMQNKQLSPGKKDNDGEEKG